MPSQSSVPWYDDFVGVAYRYYDLRMNVVPLFTDRKEAASLWHDTIHPWVDPSIKIRFLEDKLRNPHKYLDPKTHIDAIILEVWVLHGAEDTLCTQYEGAVYEKGDGPQPEDDTHPNCHCERVEFDRIEV